MRGRFATKIGRCLAVVPGRAAIEGAWGGAEAIFCSRRPERVRWVDGGRWGF